MTFSTSRESAADWVEMTSFRESTVSVLESIACSPDAPVMNVRRGRANTACINAGRQPCTFGPELRAYDLKQKAQCRLAGRFHLDGQHPVGAGAPEIDRRDRNGGAG